MTREDARTIARAQCCMACPERQRGECLGFDCADIVDRADDIFDEATDRDWEAGN